jgi:hypothetical protein
MFSWIPHRSQVVAVVALGVAAAGALGGVALAGSTAQRDVPPADAIPARMLDSEVPVPISPVLLDATNGWLTSDGNDLTAVYAGAAGNDAAIGRFVVVRQDLDAGQQTVDTVDVGKTGAIAISSAPLGSSVESSAQAGQVRFSGAGGSTGTLDLGNNDAVDVNAP